MIVDNKDKSWKAHSMRANFEIEEVKTADATAPPKALHYSKELYYKTLRAFDCACGVTSQEVAADLLDILQIIASRPLGCGNINDQRVAHDALALARRRLV
jgi:hypothetical protein